MTTNIFYTRYLNDSQRPLARNRNIVFRYAAVIALCRETGAKMRFETKTCCAKYFGISTQRLEMFIGQMYTHATHEFSWGVGNRSFTIGEEVVAISSTDEDSILYVSNIGYFVLVKMENGDPVAQRVDTIKNLVSFRKEFYNLPYEVCKAFHPAWVEGMQIYHLDRDPTNSCIDNLMPLPEKTDFDSLESPRKPLGSKNFLDPGHDHGRNAMINSADIRKIKTLYDSGLYSARWICDIWGIGRQKFENIMLHEKVDL